MSASAAEPEVIELLDSEDEQPEPPAAEVDDAVAGLMGLRSNKRRRDDNSSSGVKTEIVIDSDDEEDAAAAKPGPSGGSSSDDAGTISADFSQVLGADDDMSRIEIDLCDDDEEADSGSSSFAKQLNSLFAFDDDEDVQIVGETVRTPKRPRTHAAAAAGGAADAAIEIGDDSDQNGDAEEEDDEAIAARMQAEIDAREKAEAERHARGDDADERMAADLQAKLAREIAASQEDSSSGPSAGPTDILRAQRNQIRTWLQRNGTSLKVRDVWSNPASLPGGKLYERFASAYNAAKDQGIRLVFHGTQDQNIETICQNGLDPKYRGKNGQVLGAGEYFAENPQISIPYCAGGQRMLVFAVLMDKSGLTKRQSGIVVINKPANQLPMFVVSFEHDQLNHHLHSVAARMQAMGVPAHKIAQLARLLGPGSAAPRAPPSRGRAAAAPPPHAPPVRSKRGKGKARA